MAHQTGIEPSQDLIKLMSKALKGSIRFFLVMIKNEQLVPGKHFSPRGTWEDDLDNLLQPELKDDEPCYVFYRLDSHNVQNNYHWIFMSYTPDFAPVRAKMLYSATKATLRKAFDSSTIVDDIAATSKDELSLDGYRKFQVSKEAAPPLTEAEQEKKLISENQDHTDVGTTSRQSQLHGVAFPIQPRAMNAIMKFRDSQLSYIQLSVDVNKEVINLEVEKGGTVSPNNLPVLVPEDSPRYHLYLYKHTHEGDYQEAVVFLYSCPDFSSSIKERMLYSSCKEPLVAAIEEVLKKNIDKKIEISEGRELNANFLMNEVHPKQTIVRAKFLKPKGPSRRPKSPTNRPANTSPPARNSPVNGED